MSSSSGLRDGLRPGADTTQRTSPAIRSRTRRLISFNEDEDNNSTPSGTPGVRSPGATPSPYTSRGASPLPLSHPSRATESMNRGRQNGAGDSTDFIDASWTSLQSLASSFLGSDIARPSSNGSARTHARKPSRPDPYIRGPRSSTPSAWGPSAPSTTPEIGAGTKEDRQAYVQAKKREALLLADEGPSSGRSTWHKRRDSGGQTVHGGVDPEQDEEALVYIHHVQLTDTITSLTIRYGCQPAVFRKANGFWPSDSIQSRKTVLLPVDSCSVKGRPIRSADTDLLDSGSEDLNGSSIAPSSPVKKEVSTNTSTEIEGDRVWKPESWVQIENFPAPVEIGRVPRRALGFFPRTRRKSISYSDAEPPSTSLQRTPTTATSLSTYPTQDQSTASNRPYAGSSGSTQTTTKPPGARHQRQRSNIQLAGPGVGTLDRSSMAPGPALDGLSKFLSQHLPTLAPPLPPTTNPESGAYESISTAQSNANSLDNIGGAFEGWVRKVTSRAKASFNELQQSTSNSPNGRLQPTGGGSDLIELDDGLNTTAPPDSRGKRPGSGPGYYATSRSGSGSNTPTRTTTGAASQTATSRTRVSGYGDRDRFKDD